MNAVRDDKTFRRASEIIAGSRVAAVVEGSLRRFVAGARTSRSVATVRPFVRELQAMPAGERGWCAVLTIAAALAGHVVMAAMLPWSARPTLTLTVLVLLAAGLAAGAAAVRDR